jgi:hypothetical protein
MAYGRGKQPTLPVPPPNPTSGAGLPLFDIAPNGCRFIVNSESNRAPTHLYCGVIVPGVGAGDPPLNCYCAWHLQMMGRRLG